MTKEELIGRKFITSSGNLYKIIEATDINYIGLENLEETEEFALGYTWDNWVTLTTANKELDKEEWKLLPVENKMYKTPKGIEYGVGDYFTYQHERTDEIITYKIDKIELNKVYYSQLQEAPNLTLGVTKSIFDMRVDDTTEQQWKIVTPMKDYKQVDPKTITFNFTNTKIKVNNEDESKWIQEVAFNNNITWQYSITPQYLNKPWLYSNFGRLYYGGLKEVDYKEITIQDILNNMKEVIEVGDIVEILSGAYRAKSKGIVITPPTEIRKDRIAINHLDSNGSLTSDSYTHYSIKSLKLVSKGKKKEIIGYETVIDLPGIPKGSKSKPAGAFNNAHSFGIHTYKEVELQDTKFFKPIYKQDAIEVKFSKYTATLSKESGLVFSDGEKLSYDQVKQLLGGLSGEVNLPKAGQYKVAFSYEVKAVVVGCKSFNTKDVQVIKDAIKSLES